MIDTAYADRPSNRSPSNSLGPEEIAGPNQKQRGQDRAVTGCSYEQRPTGPDRSDQ